jgi:hypothetical protein
MKSSKHVRSGQPVPKTTRRKPLSRLTAVRDSSDDDAVAKLKTSRNVFKNLQAIADGVRLSRLAEEDARHKSVQSVLQARGIGPKSLLTEPIFDKPYKPQVDPHKPKAKAKPGEQKKITPDRRYVVVYH